MLIPCIALAGTEPMNVNTADGKVKETSSGVGVTNKPFDFVNVDVAHLYNSVSFIVDGSGSVLTTGTKNPVKIPVGGALKGWYLMGKPSGSVTVDVFRAASGAGLPVTSIIGGGGTKPSLSSAVENSSTSFTGWTSTTLTAGDNLAVSLSGISTATYCVLTLYYK